MQRPVLVVVAPFRAIRYVNDERYTSGNEAPEGENLRKERRSNVEFYPTEPPSSASSSTSYKLLALRELHNLKYVESYFVAYGDNYQFNWYNLEGTLQRRSSPRGDTYIVHST